MKASVVFAAALAVSLVVRAAEREPAADIVGKWTWTRADNSCTELYDYRTDGTLHVQSGEERTDNTYSITFSPEDNGFFRMRLKIVKDYGGKDCGDSEEDNTGQEQVVYILFHSTKPLHAVCRDSSLETCYGPLRRVTE